MLLSKASKDNYKLPMACLKIKITQRYSGKFQIFYQKEAVMGALCTIAHPIQAQCGQSYVQHGFREVKFWNCQSHITCEIFNFQTRPGNMII